MTALRSFEAFGRHLNLRDSADELCVTQSAISRQIKQLEGHLGVKLIQRNGRQSQLTELGSQYLQTISQSLGDIAQQTQLLFPNHRTNTDKPCIKLGIGPVLAEYWLLPRLEDLRQQFPSLDLEIYINRGANSETPLSHVDIELFYGPLDSSDYQCEKLFNICDFPVCSPDLIPQGQSISNLEDMLQYPLIHEVSPHWWPAWLSAVGYAGISDNHGPLIEDETLTIKLALHGQGIAMGDFLSCYQYLQEGRLIRPVKEMLVTDEWVCLLLKPHQHKPHIEQFCDWLRRQMYQFTAQLDATIRQ